MPIIALINPRHPRSGHAGDWRSQAEQGGMFMARRYKLSHRRRNPLAYFRHGRRRRNPFGASMSETVTLAGWAVLGGVGTASLPAMFLKEKNTGPMGYAGNAASVFAISWLADKFAGPRASQGAMVGGTMMIVARLIQDFMGKNLLSFGTLGAYTPTWFYPPGSSQGLLQTQAPPMAAAAPAGTGASMAGILGRGARYRSRYAR